MKIGIDLTVLQSAHRLRGIGATAINFINNLPAAVADKHSFVFFVNETLESPLSDLKLENLNYETRPIRPYHEPHIALPGFIGKVVRMCIKQLYVLRNIFFGDQRIKDLSDVDVFLQFNQNQPLPSRRSVASYIIAYDVIPYVMEYDYLPGYRTARLKGHSRKGAVLKAVKRRHYKVNTRMILQRAAKVICISKHTKLDLERYIGVAADKLTVIPLGISPAENQPKAPTDAPEFRQYIQSSWDNVTRPVTIEPNHYLLFVGGADPRRKLADLVAAFNNLRAQGHELKLVLAGDTMLGSRKVPNAELQEYLKHTSYLDDIIFLGFVSNEQREWLYNHAVAFVYPSTYEGFGLPVLEAMQYGTPVITYDTSSIREIAGDAALYAHDYTSILQAVQTLQQPSQRKRYRELGIAQANKFTWQATASSIFKLLT